MRNFRAKRGKVGLTGPLQSITLFPNRMSWLWRHPTNCGTPPSKRLEPAMSLAKQIKMFLHYCAVERQLSENTLQAYAYDLADFGKRSPKRGNRNSITTETLREYLEDMMTERSLSAGTVRRRIACLRSFFRYLEQEGKATDPFIGWRLKLPRRKRLPRALSRVETGMLLARKVSTK